MEDEMVLGKIMHDYPDALDDRKKLKALLHDFFPQDVLKRNVLMMVYDSDIISEVQSLTQIDKAEYYRFIKLIVQEFGITTENAEDGLSVWLTALGIPFERASIDEIDRSLNGISSIKTENSLNRGIRVDTNKGSYIITVKNAHIVTTADNTGWTSEAPKGTKYICIQCIVENIDLKGWKDNKMECKQIAQNGLEVLDEDNIALEFYDIRGSITDGEYGVGIEIPFSSQKRVSLPYYAPISCKKVTVVIDKKYSQDFTL